MTRTAPTDPTNPDDPEVKVALTYRCRMSMCGALPGEYCKGFDGGPLPTGRITHHFRLDKAVKDGEAGR